MITLWLRHVFGGRAGRLLGSVFGIALTVGFLAPLGTFIASSAQTMTKRAMANVPIDLQVLLAQSADSARVGDAIRQAAQVVSSDEVGYAAVAALSATTGGTTQTTGAATAVGIPAGYAARFPWQIEPIVGTTDGVVLASQTASNLHVAPGDKVSVQRLDAPPVEVTVSGVVAMPNADGFFQAIGVPAGTAPQAPPDNVLVMPLATWNELFAGQRSARPDSVHTQMHVALDHAALPQDPSAAYLHALGLVRNVELRVVGQAAIANNLAARLDGVRADALYARILFLFLGAPGIVLAMLVTLAIATSGADRRRWEQSLLRVRGAPIVTLVRLAAWEAGATGGVGVLLGLALGAATVRLVWGIVDPVLAWPWFALSALIGLALTGAAIVLPAWHGATRSTVASGRLEHETREAPLWQRIYLDLALLAVAGAMFWYVARTGYQVVLATEGVAQTSVRYEAFLAPVTLWLGAGLAWIRLGHYRLRRGVARLAAAVPGAGAMAPLISASLARQAQRVSAAAAMVSLAFAFAASTAIFNTTYDRQSRVDAELTNGADVAVTGSTGTPAAALLPALRSLPGVAVAQPLMHRMAYVGADLQDLFGIDPATIGAVTTVSDAYFVNHDAKATLAKLAATPDGILVAEETVRDFQLKPGDEVTLRLQQASDRQFHPVRFHYIGTVREFPTAPKDAFLVANAAYLAQETGYAVAEVVLLRSSGGIESTGRAVRAVVAGKPGMKVTTLGETQTLISSSLTALNLRQLTGLELGFAVLLVAAIAGIVLGLNLAERRRSFAILTALGAKATQVGAFLWTEGALVVGAGMLLGTATGFLVAKTLVAMLAGVFDPPPETLEVPWQYLGVTAAVALVCAAAAIATIRRASTQPDLEALRQH